MRSLKEIIQRLNPAPTDVVGIDLRRTGTMAVRMRKSDTGVTIVAVDQLPPIDLTPSDAGEVKVPAELDLPSRLKARFASLVLPDETAIVKLLRFSANFDIKDRDQVLEKMGVSDPSAFRLGCRPIIEAHGKTESRVLAVAVPESQASIVTPLLPVGRPAPYSVEVNSLAAITACLHDQAADMEEEAIGIAYFDENSSAFAIFNAGLLTQLRTFDLGAVTVLSKVHRTLGVDMETATNIVGDEAFDISHVINESMAPLINQLIVCRDFVERHENCHVKKLFVMGHPVLAAPFVKEINATIEAAPWEPFGQWPMEAHALPERLKPQAWEFSGALGACLATLEER